MSCLVSLHYSAFLFDWDGCLAATLDLWLDVYRRTLERFGCSAAEEEVIRELFFDWEGPRRFGVRDPEAFVREVNARLEGRAGQVALNPGALQALRGLKAAGARLAILTASRRAFVEPVLRRRGLLDLVEVVLTVEDVRRVKPHPEVVERALAALGVGSGRALMVGDSDRDVAAARRAGVAAALYEPPWNLRFQDRRRLALLRPDHRIRSLEELVGLAAAP